MLALIMAAGCFRGLSTPAGGVPVKRPAWLRRPALLLLTLAVMAAVTAWAVPGSAAVTARPAQHPAWRGRGGGGGNHIL